MVEKEKNKSAFVGFLQKNLNFIIAIAVFLIFTAFSFIKLGRNI